MRFPLRHPGRQKFAGTPDSASKSDFLTVFFDFWPDFSNFSAVFSSFFDPRGPRKTGFFGPGNPKSEIWNISCKKLWKLLQCGVPTGRVIKYPRKVYIFPGFFGPRGPQISTVFSGFFGRFFEFFPVFFDFFHFSRPKRRIRAFFAPTPRFDRFSDFSGFFESGRGVWSTFAESNVTQRSVGCSVG